MEMIFRESGCAIQKEVSGSSTKRELKIKSKEMVHSPQKKQKQRKRAEKINERNEKVAEKLRKMSIRQTCLMMERTIYAEEISVGEKQALLAKKAGNSSRGGGGWLSTAAQSL